MKTGMAIAVVAASLTFGASAYATDATSKAKFESTCAECHEVDEMTDQSAADLETKIKSIVAGTVKHKKKKLTLTDAEAKAMAQFLASGGK
jgi:mono/diheme cytochrome c family protein